MYESATDMTTRSKVSKNNLRTVNPVSTLDLAEPGGTLPAESGLVTIKISFWRCLIGIEACYLGGEHRRAGSAERVLDLVEDSHADVDDEQHEREKDDQRGQHGGVSIGADESAESVTDRPRSS